MQKSIFNELIQDRHIQIRNSYSGESTEKQHTPLNSIFQEIAFKIYESGLSLPVPDPKKTSIQGQYEFISKVIELLILKLKLKDQQRVKKTENDNFQDEEGSEITCNNCLNYESHLQKLQNQIRQHIRLQHQLKLYQQSLQEKIEEHKIDNERNIMQIEQLKKICQEQKTVTTSRGDKVHRLEIENQKLKQELARFKNLSELSHNSQAISTHTTQNSKLTREASSRKSIGKKERHYHHENKQNSGVKNKTTKREQASRKSCEKRVESHEKWRNTQNGKSSKNIIMAEKMNIERNREEKKKILQSKFDNRR